MFLIAAVILMGFFSSSASKAAADKSVCCWPWAGRLNRSNSLLLAEGGLVALVGTGIGVGYAGLLYTRLMVYGLAHTGRARSVARTSIFTPAA
jgi:hypothetical protein